jgi:hypothetical protein
MSHPEPPYQSLAGQPARWNIAISKHAFPGGQGTPGLSPVSSSRAAAYWNRHASTCVPQAVEDTRVEHHQSTRDADITLRHALPAAISRNPRSVDQSPVSDLWSPGLELGSSGISSPCTIPSETVLSQSAAEPDANLKFVQYSPSRKRKTLALKPGHQKQPPEKTRCYGPLSRPDALRTDMVRSLAFQLSFLSSNIHIQAPRVLVKKDIKGQVAGTECVFGLNQVVRAIPSKELQHATFITRRIGACSRCRRQRIRVGAAA